MPLDGVVFRVTCCVASNEANKMRANVAVSSCELNQSSRGMLHIVVCEVLGLRLTQQQRPKFKLWPSSTIAAMITSTQTKERHQEGNYSTKSDMIIEMSPSYLPQEQYKYILFEASNYIKRVIIKRLQSKEATFNQVVWFGRKLAVVVVAECLVSKEADSLN